MHAAAAARNKLWIFGGQAEAMPDAMYAFNPADRKWLRILARSPPPKRHGHSMVALKDQLVVVGGRGEGYEYLQDAWAFDTGSLTWMELNPLPHAMAYHCSFVYNDQVYVYGGLSNTSFNDEMYVLRAGNWEKVEMKSPRPTGKCGAGAAVHGNYLYIQGGFSDRHSSSVYRFDLEKLTWVELASTEPPLPRAYGGMGVLGSHLYIIGGYNGSSCLSDFRSVALPAEAVAATGVATRSVPLPYMTTPKERATFILKHYGRAKTSAVDEVDVSPSAADAKTDGDPAERIIHDRCLTFNDVRALMTDLAFRPSLVRALLGIRPPRGESVTAVDDLEPQDRPTELAVVDDEEDYEEVYEFNTEALPQVMQCGFERAHILQVMYGLHQRRTTPRFENVMQAILDEPYNPDIVVPFKKVHKYGGIRRKVPQVGQRVATNVDAAETSAASQSSSHDDNKSGNSNSSKSNDSMLLRQISNLESELEALKDVTTCAICYDLPRSYALDPCGHVLCDVCATASMKHCPFCRAPISHRLKLHI